MAETVGRTPWSARVPLDPPLAKEVNFTNPEQADGGVGCGPGGPPHRQCRLAGGTTYLLSVMPGSSYSTMA